MNTEGEVARRAVLSAQKTCVFKMERPQEFREQDQPKLGVLAFNQGKEPISANLNLRLGEQSASTAVSLKPGVSFVPAGGHQTRRRRANRQPADRR